MRVASDLFPLLGALSEIHRDLDALRKQIEELKDEVKVMERANSSIQVVIHPPEERDDESSSDESSECESVQSAPATVSY
jgi:hypothetical protein